MKTYSRLFAPDLARQLGAAGVLTKDAHGAAIACQAPPGLLIRQVGGVIESSAFDLHGGYGTGYVVSIHVAVDQPAFGIWGWKLDLPWEDPQFLWLTDPSEQGSSDDMYQFPCCVGLRYSRDEVINHRRLLKRGHYLDGLLLGYGFESIPDSFRHGATIDASVVLIDEMGRAFSEPIQLWADRSEKLDRRRSKKTSGPGLFEKRDYAKGNLTQK